MSLQQILQVWVLGGQEPCSSVREAWGRGDEGGPRSSCWGSRRGAGRLCPESTAGGGQGWHGAPPEKGTSRSHGTPCTPCGPQDTRPGLGHSGVLPDSPKGQVHLTQAGAPDGRRMRLQPHRWLRGLPVQGVQMAMGSARPQSPDSRGLPGHGVKLPRVHDKSPQYLL